MCLTRVDPEADFVFTHKGQTIAGPTRGSRDRAEYERMTREVARVNEVMRGLNDLREQGSMSKAELARVIGRNDAVVVRRFFTAQSNPELRTIAAMAEALDADIRIVPRRKRARRRATADVAGG